jgi:hypothetical protein
MPDAQPDAIEAERRVELTVRDEAEHALDIAAGRSAKDEVVTLAPGVPVLPIEQRLMRREDVALAPVLLEVRADSRIVGCYG